MVLVYVGAPLAQPIEEGGANLHSSLVDDLCRSSGRV